MDTITHAIIGAVTGDLIAGNRQGKKALIWGALIANLPDLDVIMQPFLSPAQSLLFHRGPTHSILFCALLVPLLAKFLTFIHKGNKADYKDWVKLSAWCLFSHLLVDSFNSYGTAIFYPFSNIRVSFDCIGIIDLIMMLPLILALILFIFVKRKTRARKIIASSALLLSCLYLTTTIYKKYDLEENVKYSLEQKHIEYKRILTSPLPLTNRVWLIVVEDNNGFYLAHYNRKTKDFAYDNYFLKNDNLTKSFKHDTEFMRLQRFTKGWYCISQDEQGNLLFHDLRFGSFEFDGITGIENAVMVHQLIPEKDGLKIIQGFPSRSVGWESLKKYWKKAL